MNANCTSSKFSSVICRSGSAKRARASSSCSKDGTVGKGGTIKAITERVSPRVFRVVALPAPSDREKTQMFVQRHVRHFPAAGEVVIFDRSWYNRAGVEYVRGFCSEHEHRRFLSLCPEIEKIIIDGGIALIKFWLEVGKEEPGRRFAARIDDPLRQWKLSPMDLESYRRWYDYSRARDTMLKATDSKHAPWQIVRSDDKRRARLNCISYLLKSIPYAKVSRAKAELPRRSNKGRYDDRATNLLSRPSPSVKWLAPDPDDRHKGSASVGSPSIVVGLTWQPASSLFLSSMPDSRGYPVSCARGCLLDKPRGAGLRPRPPAAEAKWLVSETLCPRARQESERLALLAGATSRNTDPSFWGLPLSISRSSSPPRTRRPVCRATDRGLASTAPGLSQMSPAPTR